MWVAQSTMRGLLWRRGGSAHGARDPWREGAGRSHLSPAHLLASRIAAVPLCVPGALCLKMFHAGMVGPKILKSMLGVSPLAAMNIMPSGSVSPDNAEEWLVRALALPPLAADPTDACGRRTCAARYLAPIAVHPCGASCTCRQTPAAPCLRKQLALQFSPARPPARPLPKV